MSKTIFITGASSGFGAATATKFAQEGWNLILLGRRRERLESLSQHFPESVFCHLICVDVRDAALVNEAIELLPARVRDIDVLVNSAGLALGMDPAQAADVADWDAMIDTNIKGLTYCTHAVLPKMIARSAGHIVNLSSTAAHYPYPGGNTYGATKAFVSQFSKNLRADLHGTGIRVSNIEPGLAESEFSLVRFKGDASAAKKVYEGTSPLQPVDIADAIHWAVHMPSHVNVNNIELMPVCQSWGPTAIHRGASF